MSTIDAVLRRSLARDADGRWRVALDPAFQGLPDTAHGGSVLAAVDAVAALRGPRGVSGVYRKRVPLGVPLALDVARADSRVDFRLLDAAGATLVDGRVAPVAEADEIGRGPVAPPRPPRPRPGISAAPPVPAQSPLHPIPVSRTCFACGIDNEIGLRLALEFDDVAVTGRWHPRETFRSEDGSLAPAALTALLDETAFWLGALASGESGMTTELQVTLPGALPFGGAIVVRGARADVRPRGDDSRYWDTAVCAWGPTGAPLARARITFVAVRGAARRLVTGMLAMNPPGVLARVFPGYAR